MLFRFFSDIIDGVAPAGVIRAVDLQCRILEDDVMAARSKLTDEAWSILGFRLFIWGLKTGRPVRGILSFPTEHIDFYKRTIQRLAKSGQLPSSAPDQFDKLLARSINIQFASDGFPGPTVLQQRPA